ncbi:MAG TPA: GMC family oxidoreductase [Pseudomonadota bacterium]|nr:GMC family oxidoreductase [Pseudomonadota bacterium]
MQFDSSPPRSAMQPALPTGVLRGAELVRPLVLTTDVVVIGSGAGGASLASAVSRAGRGVIVLEEGEYHRPSDFNQREGDMLPRLFQDGGGRQTKDGAITILSGRGAGGSTTHNTNLCKRAPAEILDRWVHEHGAEGWSASALDADYAAIESELGVTPIVEDEVNAHNALIRRGAQALGFAGGLLQHNRRGCARSGFCELGCAFDAKQNALKVLLPEVLARGGTLACGLHATAIVVQRGRAVAVRGYAVRPSGERGGDFTVAARAVVLAGSAIGSAVLLDRSGLADPHHTAGRSLRLHPSLAVAGIFEQRVEAWRGIPQSFECTEKLSFAPGAVDRTWLIPAFAHPAGFAGLLPGFGRGHAQAMRDYAHVAALAAMLHDETRGEVTADRQGRPRIRYALSPADATALFRGVQAAGEVLFAAGARRVLVPLATPLVANTPAELRRIVEHRYRPLDPALTSVHPMGSLPLGRDPRRSVVNPAGRHHHVAGLYVADGSLFPTSIGGPPQLTIYAAARKIARHLLAELPA